jgi:hypothetical protein
VLSAVAAVITLFGCGESKPGPPPDSTLTSITVTPANSKMTVGRNSPQQYTATGNYSDGTAKDLTASAAWSSSDHYVAAVSAAGVVSANSAGTATISAKTGTVSGSTNLSVRALKSITVTPSGPTLAVASGSQQLAATGVFSDSTNEDLTTTATWTSSNAAAATVNSQGMVSAGGQSGFSRIDATYLSLTGTTAISVTDQNFSDASLIGEYVLTLTGSDTRGPNWIAGRITADGNGQLAGGGDANTAAGVANLALTGTYHLALDGRGTLDLTAGDALKNRKFRVLVSPDSQRAELVSFDGGSALTGILEKQTGGPFSNASLQGTYVLALGGVDEFSMPLAGIGLLQADGAGHIVTAIADFNDDGTPVSFSTPFTGTYSIVDSGRGTLALDVDGVVAALNFVVHIVSPGQLRVLEVDTDPSRPATAGHAELQNAPTGGFSSTLFDAFVFELNDSGATGWFGLAGQIVFDPLGNVRGWQDTTSGQEEVTQGQYAVAANGRGTLEETTFLRCCSSGSRSFVFYAVSTTRMYVLEIDNGGTRSGVAELQPGWPDVGRVSNLSGMYRFTNAALAGGTQLAQMGRLKADGSGAFTGIADVNSGGVFSSVALEGSIDANDAGTSNVGRWTATIGGTSYVVYIRSNDGAVLLQPVAASSGYLVRE